MLTFNPDTHEYFHFERELASVTKILGATGIYNDKWYGKDPIHRARGKAVHLACRLIDADEYDEAGTHELIVPYARQYLNFKERTGFRGMMWEVAFAHTAMGFAGTLDVPGLDRHDEPWLIDIKSGQMPDLVGVQLAGYGHLVEEGVWMEQDITTPNWLGKFRRDNPKERFRKKCLVLPGGDTSEGQLKSFDEQRWVTVWRSCLTNYNIRKEFGKL